jgi:hypothetical protein
MKKLIILCFVAISSSGCEIGRLYETNVFGLSDIGKFKGIPKGGYALFPMPSPGTEAAAITLVAQASNRPVPSWTWDEFENWSVQKRNEAYGEYFDQVYLYLDVSHESSCPIRVERFDHRESAQQNEYSMWRSDVEVYERFVKGEESIFRFSEGTRGLFVEFPIADCENLLDAQPGELATLIVLVRDNDGEVLDEIQVSFDLRLRETFVDYWFF